MSNEREVDSQMSAEDRQAEGRQAELLKSLSLDSSKRARQPSPLARRLVGSVVIVAVALAAGGWFWSQRQPVVEVETVAAELPPGGEVPASAEFTALRGSALDASGYVVARRQATVSSKITGRVVELAIEEGQLVERDQVIARLDDTNALAAVRQSTAQLEQARANLRAARIAYENTRPQFSRHEQQYSAGFISAQSFDVAKAEYDAAMSSLDVASAAVDVAAANLDLQQRALDDTVVRAPFAGVVTVKAAQEGEMVSPVSAGGGFTRTGIGTIVDMDSLEVEVDVNESFINRVFPGQDVEVRLNAYPDWSLPARVIAVIPTADRAKATVRVRVGFDSKDPRILPQMGVRVSFLSELAPVSSETNELHGVILPPGAIQMAGDTGVVYLIEDGRLARRAVRLGARTQAGQFVTAGLSPGTQVAVADGQQLFDGQPVRVREQQGANP